jgi:hypothetical protein
MNRNGIIWDGINFLVSGMVKATGKDNFTTLLAQTEHGDVTVICQDWLSSIGLDKFRALADGEDEN